MDGKLYVATDEGVAPGGGTVASGYGTGDEEAARHRIEEKAATRRSPTSGRRSGGDQ